MGLDWKLSEILINQPKREISWEKRERRYERERETQGNTLEHYGAVQLAVNIPGSAHNERAWVVQVARIARIDLYLDRAVAEAGGHAKPFNRPQFRQGHR